jgi:hypothetical protein
MENAMDKIIEFPSKIFSQWGAIAQEIAPYLAQRGANKGDIAEVIGRLKTRWEQLEVVPAVGQQTVTGPAARESVAGITSLVDENNLHASRHWKSQSARAMIEFAFADYRRLSMR